MSKHSSSRSLITAVLPQHTLVHICANCFSPQFKYPKKRLKNQSKITKREVAESAKTQQGVEKARAKGRGGQTEQ